MTGLSPGRIFSRIRSEFEELGILGAQISLEYDGVTYRVSCDEQSFLVYRVNEVGLSRHHVPGWPVVLVSPDVLFEEGGSEALAEDHYACNLTIDTWLELISRHCRGL